VHFGQAGAHLPVDGDRAADAEFGAGGEGGVGADAGDDQDEVGGMPQMLKFG